MASFPAEETWEALTRTDDVLAEILSRLPTLADHGRACAAYAAFRRVITGPLFLRRLRAWHPPSVLGFLTVAGFHPVEAPHPSAPAALALVGAADFNFSFLPSSGDQWMVRDARGGRFLLDRVEEEDKTFTTVAVCDPLFRRYVLRPPIPQDLAVAVAQPHHVVYFGDCRRRNYVFLAPCGEEDEAAVPEPFRVVWIAQCPTKLVAFVFSSASSQSEAIPPPSWRDLNPDMPSMTERESLVCRNYAHGCFYWLLSKFPDRSKILVLDMGRMEFFTVEPPSGFRIEGFSILELSESKIGMFATKNIEGPEVHLFSANMHNHGEDAKEWVLENRVSMPHSSNTYYMLGVTADDGRLLVQGTQFYSSEPEPELGCVSLDFNTLELQWIRGILRSGFGPVPVLYIGYPPHCRHQLYEVGLLCMIWLLCA